jgi:O-antigen/teichoic acid export membrane protein
VLVTVGGLLGVAVASPVRGQAAGMVRFDLYASQVGLDGLLRIVFALVLVVVGAQSATAFGLVLVAAPLLATAVVLAPVNRTATPGPASSSHELGRKVWPLMVSVLLSQFMLNSVIVSARLLAPELTVLAAALLSALIVVRVPTIVFGAMQASLLSGLAASVSAGDRAQYGRLLRHGILVVTAMMICFAIPVVALGPWLVRTLFAAPDVLDRLDFAILATGTWAYLLGVVLGQGAMSLPRPRVQMLAWVAGAAVLVLVTIPPAWQVIRLELAYLAGNRWSRRASPYFRPEGPPRLATMPSPLGPGDAHRGRGDTGLAASRCCAPASRLCSPPKRSRSGSSSSTTVRLRTT